MFSRVRIISILLVAALGVSGFFAGRYFLAGGGSEAQQPSPLDQIAPRQTEEAAEPRFKGELLGIALAPSMDQLPLEAQQAQARLTSGGCVGIPVEQAGALNAPRPLALPDGYVLKQGYPQATACSGRPSGLEWDFTVSGAQNIPADVTVIRVITRYATPDAAASRVSVQTINGRQAVVVTPATPDGLAQRSNAFFPEPFGMTAIYAFNLSQEELLKVAVAVAEATQ